MGTIETSYCFDNVNANIRKINIATLFAKTRTSLRNFSSKISKELQEWGEKPCSSRVFELLGSIFNDHSYMEIDKNIDVCLKIFEVYLDNTRS